MLQICSKKGLNRKIDKHKPCGVAMKQEIMDKLHKTAGERIDAGSMQCEADFFVGAMSMYLALHPESEEDGSWCPPSWIFTIMRGDSVVETAAEIEADRAIERAEIKAEREYDERYGETFI